jgi:hypothetical protein
MAIERESLWLRPRVIQMRAMLRYVKNQAVEAALREFITDAEARLERPGDRPKAGQDGPHKPNGRRGKSRTSLVANRDN